MTITELITYTAGMDASDIKREIAGLTNELIARKSNASLTGKSDPKIAEVTSLIIDLEIALNKWFA